MSACPNHQPELQRDGTHWCPNCPVQPYERVLNGAAMAVDWAFSLGGLAFFMILAVIVIGGTGVLVEDIAGRAARDTAEYAMMISLGVWLLWRLVRR